MTERDGGLTDEQWDMRETFAHFGAAAYAASVLEVGLAHVLMFGDFLKSKRDEYFANKGKGFDRAKYEADFDAYMENQFAQTMGNLIKRVNAFAAFDENLKARIVAAKKRRDFLTHHYWRERSIEFHSFEGREKMQKELNDDHLLFLELDREIDAASHSVRKSIGVDDEVIRTYTEEKMARIKAGLPWDDPEPTGS